LNVRLSKSPDVALNRSPRISQFFSPTFAFPFYPFVSACLPCASPPIILIRGVPLFHLALSQICLCWAWHSNDRLPILLHDPSRCPPHEFCDSRPLPISATDDLGMRPELSIEAIIVILRHFSPSFDCIRQKRSPANPDRTSFRIFLPRMRPRGSKFIGLTGAARRIFPFTKSFQTGRPWRILFGRPLHIFTFSRSRTLSKSIGLSCLVGC
jgi:hypothetical protein